MKIIEYFTQSKVENIALLMKCLFDRIPILIQTKTDQIAEDFINELMSLISFRNPLIYYTDFVEIEDYMNLNENEESDFDIPRNIFICYPFALEKCLESFNSFNNWIISSSQENPNFLALVKEKLYRNQKFFLYVEIFEKEICSQIEGPTFPNLNIDFEKWLYHDAIKNTEVSIEKMKRIISKQIRLKKLPQELYDNVMNFSFEENELKMNLIKKEILNFYQASKRAFNTLNRFKNLKNFGLNAKISKKTLYKTIAYDHASSERLFEFIKSEWNTNYEIFLESKKISDFADTFESLWG